MVRRNFDMNQNKERTASQPCGWVGKRWNSLRKALSAALIRGGVLCLECCRSIVCVVILPPASKGGFFLDDERIVRMNFTILFFRA